MDLRAVLSPGDSWAWPDPICSASIADPRKSGAGGTKAKTSCSHPESKTQTKSRQTQTPATHTSGKCQSKRECCQHHGKGVSAKLTTEQAVIAGFDIT